MYICILTQFQCRFFYMQLICILVVKRIHNYSHIQSLEEIQFYFVDQRDSGINIPKNISCKDAYLPCHELFNLDEQDMQCAFINSDGWMNLCLASSKYFHTSALCGH